MIHCFPKLLKQDEVVIKHPANVWAHALCAEPKSADFIFQWSISGKYLHEVFGLKRSVPFATQTLRVSLLPDRCQTQVDITVLFTDTLVFRKLCTSNISLLVCLRGRQLKQKTDLFALASSQAVFFFSHFLSSLSYSQ